MLRDHGANVGEHGANTQNSDPKWLQSPFCFLAHTVSIIGLEPTRPGYTLWFGLVRTVHPGLVPRPGTLFNFGTKSEG